MVSLLLGYELEAWDDIHKLWVHEKVVLPKDLFELLAYWKVRRKDTPSDCLQIAAQLAQCSEISNEHIRKLIYNFLLKIEQKQESI